MSIKTTPTSANNETLNTYCRCYLVGVVYSSTSVVILNGKKEHAMIKFMYIKFTAIFVKSSLTFYKVVSSH